MRTIGIRQFSRALYTEVKDLPFKVTRRSQPKGSKQSTGNLCIVIPYTEEMEKLLDKEFPQLELLGMPVKYDSTLPEDEVRIETVLTPEDVQGAVDALLEPSLIKSQDEILDSMLKPEEKPFFLEGEQPPTIEPPVVASGSGQAGEYTVIASEPINVSTDKPFWESKSKKPGIIGRLNPFKKKQ